MSLWWPAVPPQDATLTVLLYVMRTAESASASMRHETSTDGRSDASVRLYATHLQRGG